MRRSGKDGDPEVPEEPRSSDEVAGPPEPEAGETGDAGEAEGSEVELGEGASEASDSAREAPAVAEEAVDYKERWLRAEAELQNFRRRSQRDLEEGVRFAEERVLLEMISVLDDLERALKAAEEVEAPESWVQGVRLVANRVNGYLASLGVLPVHPLGEPFDPQFHEALLEVDPSENASPGDVVQVVRKGYRRDGRALRAARVVVARLQPASEG